MAAAVFAGVEFGPQLPALPLLSVKLPPDLRRLMGTRIALSRAVKKHAERNAQEAS